MDPAWLTETDPSKLDPTAGLLTMLPIRMTATWRAGACSGWCHGQRGEPGPAAGGLDAGGVSRAARLAVRLKIAAQKY